MAYRVELEHRGAHVVATCPEFPGCRAEGTTREEVLQNIRRAIAYYREMCPCDITSEEGIELELVDAARR